jgi:hypothetical protein
MARKIITRNRHGYEMVEFAGALFILISCLIVPAIDFSVIPIRFGLAKSIINTRVRELSQRETLSEAYNKMNESPTINHTMAGLGGMTVQSSKLSMRISSMRDERHETIINQPATLPANWLPDGQDCPCEYMLGLTANVDINPLFVISSWPQRVPGLTAPVTFQINEKAVWENLGRDPSSGEFAINE